MAADTARCRDSIERDNEAHLLLSVYACCGGHRLCCPASLSTGCAPSPSGKPPGRAGWKGQAGGGGRSLVEPSESTLTLAASEQCRAALDEEAEEAGH